MARVGKYVRTPEIRARNREANSHPCPPGCTCGRHSSTSGGSRPCPQDCACAKHERSPLHNELIGRGVRRTVARKRREEKDGRREM